MASNKNPNQKQPGEKEWEVPLRPLAKLSKSSDPSLNKRTILTGCKAVKSNKIKSADNSS